jgi:hypothetical protein
MAGAESRTLPFLSTVAKFWALRKSKWKEATSAPRKLMKRFLLLPFLVVVPLLPIRQAYATTSSSITVSRTAHGLKLTMVIPRRVYPRNALVRLSVHIQNVSRHSVLTSIGSQCIGNNPFIEVWDAEIPQIPPHMMLPPCPVPSGQPLAAGKSVTQHVIFVLTGAVIQGVLNVGRSLAKQIATPKVAVRVSDAVPASLVVHKLQRGRVVVIQRPARAPGPLYVLETTYCGTGGGIASLLGEPHWLPVDGNRFSSGCTGPQEWHGYAGYLNYPVATIDYRSP